MESFMNAGSAPAPSAARPHVVLLASPGAGHLIPLAELARRLVEHHGFAATIVTFSGLSDSEALPSGIPTSVSTVALPAVKIDDLPADALRGSVLVELIHRSLPSLSTFLRSIGSTTPLAALVPDFLCSAALPLAVELGVPCYVFIPSSLTMIYLMRRVVELHDDAAPGEYRDLPEPLEIPGGLSLRRADLPVPYRDCNGPAYAQLLRGGRRYRRADGFLTNTFYEMEPAMAEEFRQAAEQGAFPPAFPVGPFVRSNSDEETGASAILEWLDSQPTRSVVYVAFGSGGALSAEQTVELAAGLEASRQRFLWVVRMPSLDGRTCAFGARDDDDPLAWLPEGFLERTRGRGLAVPAWAPQVRVLSHPATAIFVSHCGWNSALESAASGVPMVAWPLYAEQRMNAALLEGTLGVALRPRAREDGGVVAREEVAAAVNELMEGESGRAVRRRAEDLQRAAARAWSPDGSSRRALEDVAAKWKAGAGGCRRQVEGGAWRGEVTRQRPSGPVHTQHTRTRSCPASLCRHWFLCSISMSSLCKYLVPLNQT
ncbi:hydroquinone glucosyltransferase-like isoform X3 [Triticum dicoccoides]|uniref:hydroquinone glucosyltransferase-like isoform X3 n=2 Tax=Triticum dicoccoides TaxID=85692 RepID=UPI00188FA002|nr:hydroquinone glucosyltransferase-like isoform X3 [Triticum dicoccoides]